MAHLGNYLVGDSVPIVLCTIDKGGVPSKPTATPSFEIFKGDGGLGVAATRIPAVLEDRNSSGVFLGMFATRYLLDTEFEADLTYFVLKTWQIAGRSYFDVDTFTIGPNAGVGLGGAILGVGVIPRVHQVGVHLDTESGTVRLGINPK